jgi:hypothetical protein
VLDDPFRTRYVGAMRITTGTVVAGNIVVDDEPLLDGTRVTVLAPEDGEIFELDAAREAEILAAISEIEADLSVDGDALLKNLPPKA